MRLIIHAGYPKCGSSSIQGVLHSRLKELYELGIGIISSETLTASSRNANVMTGPSELFELLYRGALSADEISKRLDLAFDVLDRDKIECAILSAENLAVGAGEHSGVLTKILSRIHARCSKLHPVFYVRRQDELIESNWKQWFGKIGSQSFAEYVIECCVPPRFHFEAIASFFRNVSDGRQLVNVAASPFLREGDLWKDFCHICELPVEARSFSLDRRVNVSPPKGWLDFLFGARGVMFKDAHDNRVYGLVEQLLVHAKYDRYRTQSAMTNNLRQFVMSSYREQNTTLVQEFFPDNPLAVEYFEIGRSRTALEPEKLRDEASTDHPEQGYREMTFLALLHLMQEVGEMRNDIQNIRAQLEAPRIRSRTVDNDLQPDAD